MEQHLAIPAPFVQTGERFSEVLDIVERIDFLDHLLRRDFFRQLGASPTGSVA